jgi:hypothetical protein
VRCYPSHGAIPGVGDDADVNSMSSDV